MPNCFFRLIAVLHSECPASFHCTILSLAWHPFFIRVDVTSAAVYELVAEPIQELQAAEAAEQATEEVANPADLQGKPRSITPTFSIQCYYLSIVH